MFITVPPPSTCSCIGFVVPRIPNNSQGVGNDKSSNLNTAGIYLRLRKAVDALSPNKIDRFHLDFA